MRVQHFEAFLEPRTICLAILNCLAPPKGPIRSQGPNYCTERNASFFPVLPCENVYFDLPWQCSEVVGGHGQLTHRGIGMASLLNILRNSSCGTCAPSCKSCAPAPTAPKSESEVTRRQFGASILGASTAALLVGCTSKKSAETQTGSTSQAGTTP